MEQTNGGSTTPIEVQDSMEDVVKNNDNPIAYKEPVFIGRTDPKFMEAVDELLNKDLFELAILPQSVQDHCRETYFFDKLGQTEKDQLLRVKNDLQSREEALKSIYEIEKAFLAFFKAAKVELKQGSIIQFKSYELKNTLSNFKNANFSNSKIQELIEFLQVHGFLTAMHNNTPYIKQEFAITIDDTSRLKCLTNVSNNIEMEIFGLNERKSLIEQEINFISTKINNEVNKLSLTAELSHIPEVARQMLTDKQSEILRIVEESVEDISAAKVSKSYNGKSGSANETLTKLCSMKLIKVYLNEKDKNMYAKIEKEVVNDSE